MVGGRIAESLDSNELRPANCEAWKRTIVQNLEFLPLPPEDQHCDHVASTVHSRSSAAKSRLAASWRRSLVHHGLDPAFAETPAAEEEASIAIRRERLGGLLQVASPSLDWLYSTLGKSGCGVVLTDADGIILDHRYSAADKTAFEEWGLRTGADWSEAAEGTNGIGTCLAEGKSVVIHRNEHFMLKNIGMSCIDAPIFGAKGELLAALDVSSARVDQTEAINDLIAAMVAETARKIEIEHFRVVHSQCRIVITDDEQAEGAGLLAVDSDDIVVGATRTARRALGLAPRGDFDPFPAADVFGDGGGFRGFAKAEKAALVRALTREKGNVSSAAKALGVSRATLYRRMKRLGLNN